MEEEENSAEEMTTTKQGYEAEATLPQPTDPKEARKARNAAKSRERTARLHALGLTARGNPIPRAKSRDPEKQRRYQANFSARHKAARVGLGLTISEFQKLPRKERFAAMQKYGRATYGRQAKADVLVMSRRKKRIMRVPNNGLLPADNRSVKFCPHCGWNIDATRKAQAFVDGRVS